MTRKLESHMAQRAGYSGLLFSSMAKAKLGRWVIVGWVITDHDLSMRRQGTM